MDSSDSYFKFKRGCVVGWMGGCSHKLCVSMHVCVCLLSFLHLYRSNGMFVVVQACVCMPTHVCEGMYMCLCVCWVYVFFCASVCIYVYTSLCLDMEDMCVGICLCMDLYLCFSMNVCVFCVSPSSLLSPSYDSLFLLPFLSVLHNSLTSVGLMSWVASSLPVFLYFSIYPRSSSRALTIQPGGCGKPVTI